MQNKSKTKKISLVASALVVAFVGLLLAACNETGATSSASCGYVIGTGKDGHDANVHEVVYQGQKLTAGSYETVRYIPCNSRNYIINDGSVYNPNIIDDAGNQQHVGDRFNLIVAYTKTGTPITIAASAYWTLNQSKPSMLVFAPICHKYNCWTSSDQAGTANFSTEGWNGMLAENFGPAMDRAALIAAASVDDSIWKSHSVEQTKLLADGMSAAFNDVVQGMFGYSEQIFCGSGNSKWPNPDEPGKGEFICTPVRIAIDDVQLAPVTQASQTGEGLLAINQQRLTNAQALYGDDAGFFLGMQDTVAACKDAGVTCVFNIGGANSPTISVPSNASEPDTGQ
ncbi:MAG: hypothetical protein HZC02_00730 [Candidatus Levybacteria bacterium]|nr:hypothetical protein [Candidatus Levybacteria bacterium]